MEFRTTWVIARSAMRAGMQSFKAKAQGLDLRSFPEWLDRVGLLLDAKSRSCADQNARAEFVPWYAVLAFGICELVRQTKSTDWSKPLSDTPEAYPGLLKNWYCRGDSVAQLLFRERPQRPRAAW